MALGETGSPFEFSEHIKNLNHFLDWYFLMYTEIRSPRLALKVLFNFRSLPPFLSASCLYVTSFLVVLFSLSSYFEWEAPVFQALCCGDTV